MQQIVCKLTANAKCCVMRANVLIVTCTFTWFSWSLIPKDTQFGVWRTARLVYIVWNCWHVGRPICFREHSTTGSGQVTALKNWVTTKR